MAGDIAQHIHCNVGYTFDSKCHSDFTASGLFTYLQSFAIHKWMLSVRYCAHVVRCICKAVMKDLSCLHLSWWNRMTPTGHAFLNLFFKLLLQHSHYVKIR